MPKPPPRLTKRSGAGADSARRQASSYDFCCASQIAAARRFCDPEKRWKPSQLRPAAAISSSSAGTCSALTPNCLAPPPIFIPEPFSSKSWLTLTASRAATPSSAEIVASSPTSRRDSILIRTPAATAWRNSSRRLPGPAKLTSRGSAPASRATFSSPPEATSMPSTSPASRPTTAGSGFAFSAQ